MTNDEGRSRPGPASTTTHIHRHQDIAPVATVPGNAPAVDRVDHLAVWHRRERLRAVPNRRRVSAELDARCGLVPRSRTAIEFTTNDDWYAASGLTLGWPERRAAGLALIGRAA